MDRHDKLKRLKNEITRLFHEKVTESETYDQLQANHDFGSIVRRADIHSIYNHLKEKDKLTAEYEKQIEAWKNEEKQMMAKLECMKEYKQDSNKYWLYDGEIVENSRCVAYIWQNRYLVTINDQEDFHSLKVLDMFQNVSKTFAISKLGYFYRMYFLTFPFVLLHESSIDAEFLRVLRFDFESDLLQIIQTFEYEGYYHVYVDQFDLSKFVLKEEEGEMHYCKLFNEQVQIGDGFNIEWKLNYFCVSYFNGQLYSLEYDWNIEDLPEISILTYDLDLKENKSFKLHPFPEHFRFLDFIIEDVLGNFTWVKDHLFTSMHFNLTDEYGIAFAESKTCKWTPIEFMTEIPIERIQFVDGQDLMIYVKEDKPNGEICKLEVHKVSMHKPDSLRNKAWIALVKKFKNDANIDDPYAEARRFLPLNSEIQEFIFFED